MLKSFFQIYKQTTSWNVPEDLYRIRNALRSYEDLLNIIKLVKQWLDEPRNQVAKMHFSKYAEEPRFRCTFGSEVLGNEYNFTSNLGARSATR